MSERFKTAIAIAVSVVALGIIVVGVSLTSAQEPTADDRVAALSASIKCPFCSGESLADSQSGVARDYRELIAERVEAGATDEEIIAEFVANFGQSYILDNSKSPWTAALWVVPIVGLGVGGAVLVALKRKTSAAAGT